MTTKNDALNDITTKINSVADWNERNSGFTDTACPQTISALRDLAGNAVEIPSGYWARWQSVFENTPAVWLAILSATVRDSVTNTPADFMALLEKLHLNMAQAAR